MGVADLQPGMKVRVALADESQKAEYHGELLAHIDNVLTVSLNTNQTYKKPVDCMLKVTVGNVIYSWKTARLSGGKEEGGNFKIELNSRPQIKNRRKYPRMDITNNCTITMQDSGETLKGKMDNISANGFAFLVTDSSFMENKGKKIRIKIEDFAIPKHAELEGTVIRCSDNQGIYIVGCQMPEDNRHIMKYVEKNLKEGTDTFE